MRHHHTTDRAGATFGPSPSVLSTGTTVEQEFTPVEDLILDTLAARFRLGEMAWTFDARLTPTLEALAARGLVDVVGVPVGSAVRARLTVAGRAATMDETYVCANDRPDIDNPAEADDLDDLTIVRCAGGVAWQKLVTIEGSRWFSTISGAGQGFGPFSSDELIARRGRITVMSDPPQG